MRASPVARRSGLLDVTPAWRALELDQGSAGQQSPVHETRDDDPCSFQLYSASPGVRNLLTDCLFFLLVFSICTDQQHGYEKDQQGE